MVTRKPIARDKTYLSSLTKINFLTWPNTLNSPKSGDDNIDHIFVIRNSIGFTGFLSLFEVWFEEGRGFSVISNIYTFFLIFSRYSADLSLVKTIGWRYGQIYECTVHLNTCKC